MKIAFFLANYPVMSETFILDELLWLQEKDIVGKIWYENDGTDQQTQPNTKKITFTKEKIVSRITKNTWKIVGDHFFWLRTNPVGYSKVVGFVLRWRWFYIRSFIKSFSVARSVQSFDCDFLLAHEEDNAYFFAKVASILCDTRIGIIFHTHFLFSHTKYLCAKALTADIVFTQSKYSRKHLINKVESTKRYSPDSMSELKKKVVVHYTPGVEVTLFSKKERIYQNFHRSISLVSVGRYVKSKGWYEFLNAVFLLKKKYNLCVMCSLVGYGAEEEGLRGLVKKLDLGNQVKFFTAGHSERLVSLLNKSDIFVMPCKIADTGDRDMLPNAIKEAMAVGLPVITTRLGGMEELIQNNVNGILIDNANPENVAAAINGFCMLSPQKKKQLSTSAYKTIHDFHSRDMVMRHFFSDIQQIIRLEK